MQFMLAIDLKSLRMLSSSSPAPTRHQPGVISHRPAGRGRNASMASSMDVEPMGPSDLESKTTDNPLEAQAQEPEAAALSFPEYGASFSTEQARDLVSTVETLTAELRELRRRQDEAAAGLESSVRAVAGWLTEASPNWHQATIFFCTTDAPEDAELRKRGPVLFVASCIIVFVQLITLVGVIIGTLARSCVKADHCQMGKVGAPLPPPPPPPPLLLQLPCAPTGTDTRALRSAD